MLKKVSHSVDDYVAYGVKLFLVLDFDGVFNVERTNGTFSKEFYNPTNRENHPNPHYKKFDHKGALLRNKNREPKSYKFVWSNELVDDFNSLMELDDVQVVWLTTWREHMGDVSKRLGFKYGREPVYLSWGEDSSNTHSDKLPSFVDFFKNFTNLDNDGDVGMVWVDDVVLNKNDSHYVDVEKSVSFLDNLLLVGPDSWYGVSRQEFKDIKDFSYNFVD